MSEVKKFFIGVIIDVVVLGLGFCGGYFFCNKSWTNRTDSTASSTIREQLTKTTEQLSATREQLKSAQDKVAELESTINSALGSAEQNSKLIADAQATSGDIGESVEGLTSLFTEYIELVEQLQANNSELTDKLRSSVEENAGQ